MTGGGEICAQIVLTVFNIIQFLFGWLLIIAGAVTKVSGAQTPGGPMAGAAIFLIVIGSILVVVSITGCFGAWTKNYCLLVTFCIFTAIIFILVVIAVIVAFVSRSKADEAMEYALNEMIQWNDTSAFETMQSKFQCCGINSYTDWNLNPKYNNTDTLPPSCCDSNPASCKYGDSRIYKQGCKKFVDDALKHSLLILGGIAAACAIVTFLAIFSAAYMAHTIRGTYKAV